MGLEQKLLQLDEKIWKQYEKVTQMAEKYVGLDKYDLARGCYRVGGIGGVSCGGIYLMRFLVEKNQINFLCYQGLLLPFMYFGIRGKIKEIDQIEKKEYSDLSQGKMYAPVDGIERPFFLGIAMAGGACFLSDFFLKNQQFTGDNLLLNLYGFSSAFSFAFMISGDYFKSQIPKPPSNSLGKLQEWYNGLRESFGRKVEVGVKCEGIEERVE